MKILIIDNLYQPSKAGVIANGAQKFTRNQMTLLSEVAETFYITAKGSDKQFANQFILDGWFDLSLEEKSDKVKQTRKVAEEILKIIKQVQPDVVLDSSCKHMSSIWEDYPSGIIFEHYHKSSAPLGPDTSEKFSKKKAYWVGVSKWQAKHFNNYFDDTICIHYIDEAPEEVKAAGEYGIFVGRWDGGKAPHVALKNYLKSGSTYPIKCFIKFGGQEIPAKELENLKKSPLLEFHIDAPRQEILDAMSRARFGLGMGNESTGIVCLEYAMFGVPYIVPGNKVVAEMEHIPAEGLFLCDRSLDTPIHEQYYKHVNDASSWSLADRVYYSKLVRDKYNKEHFINEHLRIIRQAQGKYPKGFLSDF
jgi:glycosyltransferase involved in cell wall biosynthesis